METTRIDRKLTTIFSADVKGYSRLMRENEVATIHTLKAYREVISSHIEKHGGRVIDSPGDNLLAEFRSVVHAVESSVEIQRALKKRNEELPEGRRMEFRIGINLGDVVVDEERLYGDGVNIAARLEGLAEGGGICISDDVHRQVEGKLPLSYKDLGEQEIKNISKPVRAYWVVMEPEAARTATGVKPAGQKRWRWAVAVALVAAALGGAAVWNFYLRSIDIEPASIEKMAFPLPKIPSIAVLPFTNMSGNKEQEYFADGITDDLITDLSKISGLFVIARNSTFTYKGKAVKIHKIAEELGVRYVLEGSVRRSGDRVRVNAQLIDATTGGHLWAERYDHRLDDIFTLQDTITGKVVQALELRLTKTDRDRRSKEPRTNNPEAYDLVLQARKLMTRFHRKAANEARDLLDHAIELDPDYAEAYSLLGLYYFDAWRLWGENRGDNLSRSSDLGRAAIKLSPLDPAPHTLLAQIHQFRREFDAANAEADAALALGPNDAVTLANLGSMLRYAHRAKEAAEVVERAIRLDPYHPPNYLEWLGDAYLFLGRLNDCIETVERGIALESNFVALHVIAAKCYAALGNEVKAREAGTEVLRINPHFTLRAFASYVPFSDERDLQHNVEMLRKAGVPE